MIYIMTKATKSKFHRICVLRSFEDCPTLRSVVLFPQLITHLSQLHQARFPHLHNCILSSRSIQCIGMSKGILLCVNYQRTFCRSRRYQSLHSQSDKWNSSRIILSEQSRKHLQTGSVKPQHRIALYKCTLWRFQKLSSVSFEFHWTSASFQWSTKEA